MRKKRKTMRMRERDGKVQISSRGKEEEGLQNRQDHRVRRNMKEGVRAV